MGTADLAYDIAKLDLSERDLKEDKIYLTKYST
jgi:hypothetical protein